MEKKEQESKATETQAIGTLKKRADAAMKIEPDSAEAQELRDKGVTKAWKVGAYWFERADYAERYARASRQEMKEVTL